jgi:hypothetical protein
MNWKIVSLLVCALVAAAAFVDARKRSHDRETAEFLRQQPEARLPMHNPPTSQDIMALAERDASSFCYPADRSADGCQFSAVLIENEWTVFARPYLGSPGHRYNCCAVDSARLFIYSRKGAFLRQEPGGP